MKIKEILQVLLADDASDHAGTGEEMDTWQHGDNCVFCKAAREAQFLIGPDCPRLLDFEPGDDVLICGRAPGVVERVRTQVDVRLGAKDDKLRPVGTFALEFISHADRSHARTWWRDAEGDVWERDEATQNMLIVQYADGSRPEGVEDDRPIPTEWRWSFEKARKTYGHMTQVDKP